jgi:hypothetical protein
MDKTERIERRAELRETYGNGTEIPDGTVLRWCKVFDVDSDGEPKAVYTYVAIKVNNRFVICGQPSKVDWADLLMEIEKDNIIDDPIGDTLEIADSWYLMIDPEDG